MTLFNDVLNTFLIRLYGFRHMVNDHSDSEPAAATFPLIAKVLLYAPSNREDSTYHGISHTSRGALAGTRNSGMREGKPAIPFEYHHPTDRTAHTTDFVVHWLN